MASSSERTLLPFDLVEEILCRIPLEYLLRLQFVCKQWYSLFKNKRFIYKYLDLTQERFIRIDSMVRIIDPVAQTRINSPTPAEFPCRPSFSPMLHCDGLVLLKFDNAELLGHRRLLILNPILGQIKWIQPRIHYLFHDTYGIGYNNVSDYKILRFFNSIYDPYSGRREYYGVNLEIYDLKSNSWSIVDVSLDWLRDLTCEGVSVNGNMYWTAHWNNTDPKTFIQSFDFSTETFKPKSCPPFEARETISLSCFRRVRLSLLHQFDETNKIEVWVTNKVDEEVMVWNKYFTFASPDLPVLYVYRDVAAAVYFIDKNDKLRVWCEEDTENEFQLCVSICETGKDEIKREVETVDFMFFGYVYVPSLVPLPGYLGE